MPADPQVRDANGCRKDAFLLPLYIMKAILLALVRVVRSA
jgi:hypothetical protein